MALTYYLAVKDGVALLLIASSAEDARRQATAKIGEPDVCLPIKLNIPLEMKR